MKLIWAESEDGYIGRDGGIPWLNKNDLRRFKELTLHHTVIMGRKTFESLGGPLRGRKNVVVTNTLPVITPGVRVLRDPDRILHPAGTGEPWVIGGRELYDYYMPYARLIYRTVIHTVVGQGDTKAPAIPACFRLLSSTRGDCATYEIYGRVE